MKKLGFAPALALLIAGLVVPGNASGQAFDNRYQLRVASLTAPAGPVNVPIQLDSIPGTLGAPLELQGWSFGVCHNAAQLTLVNVLDGATTMTVNGGGAPDFNAVNENPVPGTGFTIGVVIDFFGVERLDPGTNYELNVGQYTLLLASGSATISFCNTLATPPVETLVVQAGGSSAIPVQTSGVVTVPTGPSASLTAADVTGAPGSSQGVNVTMGNPDPAEGFSFGLVHTAAVAVLTAINEGAASAATNGGSGADFFFGNIAPALPVGSTGGGFVGGVVSLSPPFETIAAGIANHIATFQYNLVGANGANTAVTFSGQVGNPAVAIVISVAGGAVTPSTDNGSITIVGIPVINFIRGDANDDGVLNVSDAVFLAKWLFNVGPAGACNKAGDVNDNGTLDAIGDPMALLAYLFQGGPAPAAPGLACGADGTMDALTCNPVGSCP